jgi:UDP-glucose 4-epimerase
LKNKILITGIDGFLGRHCTQYFSQKGYEVYGVGHGKYAQKGTDSTGLSTRYEVSITKENLLEIGLGFTTIIHCAGGSSVANSFENPVDDYTSNVATTLEILEYIKQFSPDTRLIYPSSAAVYGESKALKNSIHDKLNPDSPYGIHKKVAENLCLSYQQFFDIDVSVIRFFSIYGPGLKKQLIWDACNKLISARGAASFWGSGKESRDWLYLSDALDLIYSVATAKRFPRVLNGGTGESSTIEEVLYILADLLGLPHKTICFTGEAKTGDPSRYLADTEEANFLGWKPSVGLKDGLERYLDWFKTIKE